MTTLYGPLFSSLIPTRKKPNDVVKKTNTREYKKIPSVQLVLRIDHLKSDNVQREAHYDRQCNGNRISLTYSFEGVLSHQNWSILHSQA